MKIALVNLCEIEDFSKTNDSRDSFEFLRENNIDFVDYVSGRESPDDLLGGFHEALGNDKVGLIWFIQGGNKLIRFLDKINWELVKQSNKEYLGLSDFTHFAFRAVQLGKICYYGQGLKKIKIYLPTPEERLFVVSFLKQKKLPRYNTELLYGNGNLDLKKKKIIGGHSFISAIMLPNTAIDLTNRFLFFEHHYLPSETPDDAKYFLDAVKLYLYRHKPQGFILGHSMLFNKDNGLVDTQTINKHLLGSLTDFGLPIYYIDHFKTIIKFS